MMSTKDGDRLPHRRILTGSDLMKCDDRIRCFHFPPKLFTYIFVAGILT